MKAIIIAAGRAKRMGYSSNSLPKCLLDINGKTIMRRQIDTLKICGIEDIVVIKGYKKELLNYDDVRYRINDDYLNNDILSSLFFAEEDIIGDVLISYGDILFKPNVVNPLIAAKGEIVIAVETKWKERYRDRKAHPESEAEKVVIDSENRLVGIGKVLNNSSVANGEFIGMVKINTRGATILKDTYHRVKKMYKGKPFQHADIFENAYLTDMLQELIDSKNEIICVDTHGDWQEIDTFEDYLKAQQLFT